MTIPDWLKPGVYGALLGAALVGVFGFSWAGWMTEGGAEEMATEMAQDKVIAALVPFCVEMARTDIERVTKLETIRDATSFRRRDAVIEAGWATMPGSDGPNRELAQACIEGLELDAS
ncbi:MAG: hypothetical protein AAFO63_02045 [Pseudomonadota bacterium]